MTENMSDTDTHDPQVQAMLRASADLAEATLAGIKETDPDAAAGLAQMLRGGGWLETVCQLTATGTAWVRCDAVAPNGERHQLQAVELRRVTRQ